ncbi:hypothetical protein EVAR_87432_1 [Eumeta japonica]|uniref:Uncharacterized protein n=1 Tax=Eumeta variegata TaxID=151549 RepID=A0A4C1XIW9_EUMVA|nr:hypothetical protein EVAR_87432_1 [Eumeta japonica]
MGKWATRILTNWTKACADAPGAGDRVYKYTTAPESTGGSGARPSGGLQRAEGEGRVDTAGGAAGEAGATCTKINPIEYGCAGPAPGRRVRLNATQSTDEVQDVRFFVFNLGGVEDSSLEDLSDVVERDDDSDMIHLYLFAVGGVESTILTYLKSKSKALSEISVVGCDGTVDNTGSKGGVIRLMEELKKPLQWHLWQTNSLSRYLNPDLKKIVDDVIQRNGYFGHPENVLIAMLGDDMESIRELTYQQITKARSDNAPGLRTFKTRYDRLEPQSDIGVQVTVCVQADRCGDDARASGGARASECSGQFGETQDAELQPRGDVTWLIAACTFTYSPRQVGSRTERTFSRVVSRIRITRLTTVSVSKTINSGRSIAAGCGRPPCALCQSLRVAALHYICTCIAF